MFFTDLSPSGSPCFCVFFDRYHRVGLQFFLNRYHRVGRNVFLTDVTEWVAIFVRDRYHRVGRNFLLTDITNGSQLLLLLLFIYGGGGGAGVDHSFDRYYRVFTMVFFATKRMARSVLLTDITAKCRTRDAAAFHLTTVTTCQSVAIRHKPR